MQPPTETLPESARSSKAWRVAAPTSDPTLHVDLHLVFFARKRIVGTCLSIGVDRVMPEDLARIVNVFEARILAVL